MAANRWPHHQGGRVAPADKVILAKSMKDSGYSTSAIAAHFKVSRQTIGNWLRTGGGPPKPQYRPRGVDGVDDAVPVKFRLVVDRRSDVYERRRWDCAYLRACEVQFILAHGARQGKCPSACDGSFRQTDGLSR